MSIIKSEDYHDFVIKDGKFIGEFEQMYQQVDDPWGCAEGVGALKNDLLLAAVNHLGQEVKRALDVGCGLGALTARLRKAAPFAEWRACDVSTTAVESAAHHHQGINFFQHDLNSAEVLPGAPATLDLITMAELMWYVLPSLTGILRQFHGALRPGGHFLVLQYFLAPDEQQYGREVVGSPDDLINLVIAAGFQIRQEIYIGRGPSRELLLWATNI